jgi:predicted nucleic acid-binding protein
MCVFLIAYDKDFLEDENRGVDIEILHPKEYVEGVRSLKKKIEKEK